MARTTEAQNHPSYPHSIRVFSASCPAAAVATGPFSALRLEDQDRLGGALLGVSAILEQGHREDDSVAVFLRGLKPSTEHLVFAVKLFIQFSVQPPVPEMGPNNWRRRLMLNSLTGTTLFDPTIYFLSHMPSRMETSDIVWIVSMAIALSLLATLYPSWRAARLDPVEALRYE